MRPPSFCNLQALPRLVKGHLVADVVALIGSIDIVMARLIDDQAPAARERVGVGRLRQGYGELRRSNAKARPREH